MAMFLTSGGHFDATSQLSSNSEIGYHAIHMFMHWAQVDNAHNLQLFAIFSLRHGSPHINRQINRFSHAQWPQPHDVLALAPNERSRRRPRKIGGPVPFGETRVRRQHTHMYGYPCSCGTCATLDAAHPTISKHERVIMQQVRLWRLLQGKWKPVILVSRPMGL